MDITCPKSRFNYSITQENLRGNSRYEAMSGAFGALGGNLSAIHINPAASAVFNTSEFGLSVSSLTTENKTTYFGTSTPTQNKSGGMNQIGGVFVFKNDNYETAWKKIAFGFNAQIQNSYHNNIQINGTNTVNGLDNYFLDYAAGKDGGALGLSDFESVRDVYQFFGESSSHGFGYQQAFLAIKPIFLITFQMIVCLCPMRYILLSNTIIRSKQVVKTGLWRLLFQGNIMIGCIWVLTSMLPTLSIDKLPQLKKLDIFLNHSYKKLISKMNFTHTVEEFPCSLVPSLCQTKMYD